MVAGGVGDRVGAPWSMRGLKPEVEDSRAGLPKVRDKRLPALMSFMAHISVKGCKGCGTLLAVGGGRRLQLGDGGAGQGKVEFLQLSEEGEQGIGPTAWGGLNGAAKQGKQALQGG